MIPQNRNCGNCKFHDHDYDLCKKPLPSLEGQWPSVKNDDYCSNHDSLPLEVNEEESLKMYEFKRQIDFLTSQLMEYGYTFKKAQELLNKKLAEFLMDELENPP